MSKKYWKIPGIEGLWVLHVEDAKYRRFRKGASHLRVPKKGFPIRPATFEEIHGRVKPPEIWGGRGRGLYELDNPKVVTVYQSRGKGAWEIDRNLEEIDWFPTHAEAIAYAQKHAHQ